MPENQDNQQQLKRKKPQRLKSWHVGVLGLLVLWMIVAQCLGDRQIIINTSPSAPRGLYLRVNREPAVGMVVDFALPESARTYVQARCGYAGRDWYILKRIAAGPGDRIDTTGQWLIINGQNIAAIEVTDSAGRPLPHWRGNRKLGPDEYFVYSGRIANSFDSRYYGPLKREQIAAVRVPLILW